MNFKVEYLVDQKALSISASVKNDCASTAFTYSDNPQDLAMMLNAALNQLVNGKRTSMKDDKIIMVDPLIKGLMS